MDEPRESVMNDVASAGAWPWSLVLGFTIAWLIAALYAFSNIEIDILWFLALAFFGVVIGLLWFVMTALEAVVRIKRAQSLPRPKPRRIMAWLLTPLLGLLGVWLAQSDLDFLLRLRLSEPALTAHAQQIRATHDPGYTSINGWIGLLPVYDAQLGKDGTVRYSIQSPGIFTNSGLYYDPDHTLGAIAQSPEERERIFGPWVKFIISSD